jgi:ADP-ribosylglycohydrolase
MFGTVIGDMLGCGFAERTTRSYKLDLTECDRDLTFNTVMMAAVCDMLCYTAEPPSGRIDRAVRTREVCDLLKKYARLFPDLIPPNRRAWVNRRKREHCIEQADFSPVFTIGCAYVSDKLEDVLALTEFFCSYICDTDGSRNCAKAVNSAVWALRQDPDIAKENIADYVVGLEITDDSCNIAEELSMKRTPEAAVLAAFSAFGRSYDLDSALRYAIAFGAMSPTVAAAAGALAGEYYKPLPEKLAAPCRNELGAVLKIPLERFIQKYIAQ